MICILIDREKIIQAKEKLGDRMAFIIAEELELEQFDERNLKACCSFHTESTPSFIWNKKALNYYCFGACGRSYDIIDVFMHKGNTYLEACQKLFELADIPYSFGEHGVKTKRDYRYPKPIENGDKTTIYEYLSLRSISEKTADYLDLRQDEHGNIAFNYYDLNDVLVMVKYRPSKKIERGESKNWCQKDADTTPILFNINRINPDQPLVITTGELDCAALIEAGVQNTVSVPLGDQNLAWIEECWDFLEQIKEIIVVHDNDESGYKYVKTVVPRLGSWRCKVAHCPETFELPSGKIIKIKDVNEVLVRCGKDAVINMVANATDSPIPSVIDFSDIEEKDLSNMDGIETGIDGLDKEVLKLFYGSFNILSGTPGSGKTSWLYQVMCNALDQGTGTWLFSRELPSYMTKSWTEFIFAGPRNVNRYETNKGGSYYRVKPEAKKLINEHYRGLCHVYRDDYSNSLEDLQSSMEDSARKYGSKLFIVDNLMTVDLHTNDSNQYDKQTEFVNWLIHFSAKFDVCTILVAHPRKLQYGQDSMEMYDVAGTSNLVNLAHRGIGLKRIYAKEKAGTPNRRGDGWEKPPYNFDVRLTILKDRFRGKSSFELGMHYCEKSRRFFTCPEDYDTQYNWDANTYTDVLEYPIKDTEVDQMADKEIYVGNRKEGRGA